MAGAKPAAKTGATFVIPVDIFNLQVGVFRTDEQRVDAMRDLGVSAEPAAGAALATAHLDLDPEGQAWFGMVIKADATRATWAHECVHIADWIMEHHGIPTEAMNTEVRAYLVGHLFAGLERELGGDDG